MHKNVINLIAIKDLLKQKTNKKKLPKVIAVSKTFSSLDIMPLIEHGQIDLKSCKNKPEIGEQVQIILAHPWPGFNEHDSIYALRDGRVEAVWPVDARGAIR